ncbi:MAG: hypothetical protein ACXVEE_41460, partial [Polyangiales bacterium]
MSEAAKEEKESSSLGERIETTRFLGRELLTWIWFESEVFEQSFSIESFGECTLWLEKKLTLESAEGEREKEKSTLTGVAPSGSPEAREALRQGKLPSQARIVIERDDQSFTVVLDADSLAMSSVKIPAVVKGEGEDPFYERIGLIEELESAIESLYRDFLRLRLDASWSREVLPAIRLWMRDESGAALDRYKKLRARKPATKKEKRPQRKAVPESALVASSS